MTKYLLRLSTIVNMYAAHKNVLGQAEEELKKLNGPVVDIRAGSKKKYLEALVSDSSVVVNHIERYFSENGINLDYSELKKFLGRDTDTAIKHGVQRGKHIQI